MIIEVKGIQFVNKGAELMLHAILQQMRQRMPHAELALGPHRYSPYLSRAAVGAWQKVPLRKGRLDLNGLSYYIPARLRQWLKRNFGLLTEADIDVIFDASGFAYSDQWPEDNIRAMSAEIKRFSRHGKTYILLPQAFGPFSRPDDIKLLQTALPQAALIVAREQTSLEHIRTLIGDKPNMCQFPDFTNLVAGVLPEYYTNGQQNVLIIPNSNMLNKRNQHTQWQHTYLEVLLNAIMVIRAAGLTPVLLNHEVEQDAAICQQLISQTAGNIELITESDPLKVKGIIGASKAVICSRYHGCISALSQGVPCLGTSWSHKYERLFDEYGQPEALLSADISAGQLQHKLQHVINNAGSEQFVARRAALKHQSEQLWQTVAAVIPTDIN
ncbi:polysaccharide pyruvyl transferase family protein [Rheinheimera metallidurans]|uniref:polysaccharide pyruvyl transferase family protein n=1 Tax=Rheinheimera metallidurans TaxID=2925781 RepID=UPI0030013576